MIRTDTLLVILATALMACSGMENAMEAEALGLKDTTRVAHLSEVTDCPPVEFKAAGEVFSVDRDCGEPDVKSSGTPVFECTDLTMPGTFILQNDVQADGTCFRILRRDVTLDLNNRVVSYGANSQGQASYGIEISNSMDFFGSVVRIENGFISQHAGATPMSHAIYSAASGDVEIVNLTTGVHAPSSQNIRMIVSSGGGLFYPPGEVSITDSVFYSNVQEIQSVYSYDGALIHLAAENNDPGSAKAWVFKNTLIGGAQAGIVLKDIQGGSEIYENDIQQSGKYYHSYGIVHLNGQDAQIYENMIHPFSGGGIRATGSNVLIYANEIDAIQTVPDALYNGGINVRGISVLSNSTMGIYDNVITAKAGQWPATAFAVFSLASTASVVVTGNTIHASHLAGSTATADAVVLSGVPIDTLTLADNVLGAGTTNVRIDSFGARDVLFRTNTFLRLGQASDYYTIRFYNDQGSPSIGMVFEDNLFTQGASHSSADMTAMVGLPWGVPEREYWVKRTPSLQVLKGQAPVSSAFVTIRDSFNAVEFSGWTNEQGMVPITSSMTAYRSFVMGEPMSLERVVEMRTPHLVNISHVVHGNIQRTLNILHQSEHKLNYGTGGETDLVPLIMME